MTTISRDGVLAGEEVPSSFSEIIDQLRTWIGDHPDDDAAREEIIEVAGRYGSTARPADRRKARPIADINGPLPTRILAAHGQGGAVATQGTVTVLSGSGGVGKSTFIVSLAAGFAKLPFGKWGEVVDGLFDGLGGPVLLATYEDEPEVTAWRVERYFEEGGWGDNLQDRVAHQIHLIDLLGRPLFGPIGSEGRSASYSTRPGPLDGWTDLWTAVDEIRPVVVIIDPALAAFAGDSNSVGPVRDFLSALALQARKYKVAIILITHSNKASRKGDSDAFDPGLVGGSAAWADGGRAVITMTRLEGGDSSSQGLHLAIVKCNYGPSYIKCALDTITTTEGALVGFKGRGGWSDNSSASTDTYQNGKQDDAFKR